MSMVDYDMEKLGKPPPLPVDVPVTWRGAGGMLSPCSGFKIFQAMRHIFDYAVRFKGHTAAELLAIVSQTRNLEQPDLNKPHGSWCKQLVQDIKYKYPFGRTPETEMAPEM